MRHYIPMKQREEKYLPNEYYTCKHGCGNTTFSSLPRTMKRLTEFTTCARCGVGILFSTVELPRKIGYPRSRRTWTEPVQVFKTSKLQKVVQGTLKVPHV